jgi:hypothetical protein
LRDELVSVQRQHSFFLDLSLRVAHELRACEISVGYSDRKRRPRRVSIARGHRGNEPASTVEAFCDSVDRDRAAIRLARRIAVGFQVDKGALAGKSVSAGRGGRWQVARKWKSILPARFVVYATWSQPLVPCLATFLLCAALALHVPR